MGSGSTGRTVEIRVGGRSWSATSVDMGNPHAVALIDEADDPSDRRRRGEPDRAGKRRMTASASATEAGQSAGAGERRDADGAGRLAALDLSRPPEYDPNSFPNGVNVEFVSWLGPGHLAMRVHERGVGETRSCGTGACAAHLAMVDDERVRDSAADAPSTTVIDVRGGRLAVRTDRAGHVHLKGPAVLTAVGTYFD
jgi:diaminopimelate epimerase